MSDVPPPYSLAQRIHGASVPCGRDFFEPTTAVRAMIVATQAGESPIP